MEDKFIRYSKLYILLFLLFLSVPVIIGLIIATFYGFSKLVSLAPAETIFELLIITIPASLFTTIYLFFARKTKFHPSIPVRIISWIVFGLGVGISVVFLFLDMRSFFLGHNQDIVGYLSFSLFYLAGNMAALFAVAIMQALSTEKEKDWRER